MAFQGTNPLAASSPVLAVKEVQDIYLRKNFLNLQNYFSQQNQLLNFKFFEYSFTEAQTNFRFQHGYACFKGDLVRYYRNAPARRFLPAQRTANFNGFAGNNAVVNLTQKEANRLFRRLEDLWIFLSPVKLHHRENRPGVAKDVVIRRSPVKKGVVLVDKTSIVLDRTNQVSARHFQGPVDIRFRENRPFPVTPKQSPSGIPAPE